MPASPLLIVGSMAFDDLDLPSGQARDVVGGSCTYAGLAASQAVVLVGTGRVTEIWSPHNLGEALTDASTEEETLFANLVGLQKPSTPMNGS